MIVLRVAHCGGMAGDSKVPMRHPSDVSERTIAITGGDAGYFDLMQGLRRLAARDDRRPRVGAGHPRLRPDGGAARLVPRAGRRRSSCRSGISTFPAATSSKDGYKALTARPFLPRYFPGFDLYLWIDGDCWVQQGDAIALFLARRAHRRARRGAGDPSLDAPLSPCLGRVLRGQRRGLRSLLRQGDGRAADPLSHDQCRRLRARRPTRRTGRAGPI